MNGDYLQIFEQLENIAQGDIVYVVSDVLELAKAVQEGGQRFDRQQFIQAVLERVGEEGTVLFPAFNWGFCRGQAFDYRRTPSMTGALSREALRRPDFKRTRHPIYSFAVWGRYQEELCGYDNRNAFGRGSIFDFLYQKHAKALVIGLPTLAGLTFIHHVEQMVGVPYRYEKEFSGMYIDEAGLSEERKYSMYVRDLDMDPVPVRKFEPLGTILEQLNVSSTEYWRGIPFHVVDLRAMYAVVEIDIRCNDSRNMYRYKGQAVSLT